MGTRLRKGWAVGKAAGLFGKIEARQTGLTRFASIHLAGVVAALVGVVRTDVDAVGDIVVAVRAAGFFLVTQVVAVDVFGYAAAGGAS